MSQQHALHLPMAKGRVPIVHKFVYELRYHEGYTYLDRCGRIINMIQRDYPEWTLQAEQMSPQGAPLVSLQNASSFTFSSRNLSLALEKPQGEGGLTREDVECFFAQADALTSVVVDQLGLKPPLFTRIGFRAWFLFPCKDKDDGESWMLSLGCYSVPEKMFTAFAGKLEATTASVTITGEDRCFRVTFQTAERQLQMDLGDGILSVRPRMLPQGQRKYLMKQMEQKRRIRQNPDFVAMVDIDTYQDDPVVLDISDFLKTSWENGYQQFCNSVSRQG